MDKGIILLSQSPIGLKMNGPAIRYWELAHELAAEKKVVLAGSLQDGITSDRFDLLDVKSVPLSAVIHKYSVLITQHVTPWVGILCWWYGVSIILDLYDPVLLEVLEVEKNQSKFKRKLSYHRALESLRMSVLFSHHFICASEEQKSFWLGMLAAWKKMDPLHYNEDPTCSDLLRVVPFGLSNSPSLTPTPMLREKYGLKKTDTIFIWGGGIWDWFDPITPIRAISNLSKKRDDIILFFLGFIPHSAGSSEFEIGRRAVDLARELGVLNKQVYFNDEWIDYNKRQGYFVDSDCGITAHHHHLETRFAFRTRNLDYLWCGLPIISTEGDTFARLIRDRELGCVIPYENIAAWEQAFLLIADEKEKVATYRKQVTKMSEEFKWSQVVKELECLIRRIEIGEKRKHSYSGLCFWYMVKFGLWKILKRSFSFFKVSRSVTE